MLKTLAYLVRETYAAWIEFLSLIPICLQPFPRRKTFPSAEKQTERKGENSITMQPISFLHQLSNLNTSHSYKLWNESALVVRQRDYEIEERTGFLLSHAPSSELVAKLFSCTLVPALVLFCPSKIFDESSRCPGKGVATSKDGILRPSPTWLPSKNSGK